MIVGGGRSSSKSRLGAIEKLLAQRREKLLDLSDSDYFLITPTSIDFSLLDNLISSDIGRIRAAIFVDDGLEDERFKFFKKKISIVTSNMVTEVKLDDLSQMNLIYELSELAKLKENGLKGLVVCNGFLSIPLFHLAMYLDARAIELVESGYKELITYPTWKLNEISLAILYVVWKLEEAGEKASPQAIVKCIRIKSKMKRKGDERSKLVSLDYYLKKYLMRDGLIAKRKDPNSKRGVIYVLTPKGRKVAQIVEAHFAVSNVDIEDLIDLESLNDMIEVPVKS